MSITAADGLAVAAMKGVIPCKSGLVNEVKYNDVRFMARSRILDICVQSAMLLSCPTSHGAWTLSGVTAAG